MPSIRPARHGDCLSLSEVFHAAGLAGWSHFLPPERLRAERLKEEMFVQAVRAPEATVQVSESDGLITGFALTRPSADRDAGAGTGELHMFYVHPSAWGTGTADRLMDAALGDLTRRGFAWATLWTAEDNQRPRAFYTRRDWAVDGATRSKTRYGVTFTELRYGIALRGG
ncbi:GNAT family N-acetyltransferase [Nocardiopsis gilva YIM 90087]|uniref:GNAT family N-acetyltransferase n=1 Tax=Nocardiopsis gilva YIM 90087 TaxID=1235441 RepID=A0A223SA66_9ACTN|nr:GNAT family N-acetyltransferase [Nocardiopsis gilva]ASU84979.1 GNAT family N-acetyltransferase [Nocardiopsis gilva YIM 90087]